MDCIDARVGHYPTQTSVSAKSGIELPASRPEARCQNNSDDLVSLARELLVRFRPKTAFMGTRTLALAVHRRWAPATEWSQR
jgi:hypothetical protein